MALSLKRHYEAGFYDVFWAVNSLKRLLRTVHADSLLQSSHSLGVQEWMLERRRNCAQHEKLCPANHHGWRLLELKQEVTLISAVGVPLGLWLLAFSSLHSVFLSPLLSVERWLLGVEPSFWLARSRAGSNGEGAASPGDTGDMSGALTGRLDLLSGVDAIAEIKRRHSVTFKKLLMVKMLPSGSEQVKWWA